MKPRTIAGVSADGAPVRVVALTKYDREAASTRQRFLQYAAPLAEAGIVLEHRPLLGGDYVRSLVTGGKWSRTAAVRSYASRLWELLRGPRADLLWLHAEAFPYLPFGFDRLIFRSKLPVVYDWDDDFSLNYNENRNPLLRAMLSGKIERLISGAAAATCGNELLRDYAAQYCPSSLLLPTVVDTDNYRPAHRSSDRLIIGWIGSPSSWPSVQSVLPVIAEICRDGEVGFRAVGAGVHAEKDLFPGMELVDWTEEREVAEVQRFDIGIMPLLDGAFARGKSAYKLIQYMACGIPSVASPVGANNDVLSLDCGRFADSPAQWQQALAGLIADAPLRRKLGAAGRKRAIVRYSLQAHAPRLAALFHELTAPAASSGAV